MQTNRTPTIVAKLDLSDENQRIIQTLIERTHTGRWPLWRSLGMRQAGGLIFEAVQWMPRRRSTASRFSLLRWDIARLAVSWTDMPSRTDAIHALSSLAEGGGGAPSPRHQRGVAAVSSIPVAPRKRRHHQGVTASSAEGKQPVVR